MYEPQKKTKNHIVISGRSISNDEKSDWDLFLK